MSPDTDYQDNGHFGIHLRQLQRLQSKVGNKASTADVFRKIINPKTKKLKCSYAMFLARFPPDEYRAKGVTIRMVADKARYFVSHNWGERFSVLVASLQAFCEENEIHPVHTYFWIDTFCINQHSITEVKDPSWWQNNFDSRIESIGHTLALFYPPSNPAIVKRSWCVWELYTTTRLGVKLDVVAPQDAKARELERKNESQLELMVNSVSCRDAHASVAADRDAINKQIKESGVGFEGVDKRIREVLVNQAKIFAFGRDRVLREFLVREKYVEIVLPRVEGPGDELVGLRSHTYDVAATVLPDGLKQTVALESHQRFALEASSCGMYCVMVMFLVSLITLATDNGRLPYVQFIGTSINVVLIFALGLYGHNVSVAFCRSNYKLSAETREKLVQFVKCNTFAAFIILILSCGAAYFSWSAYRFGDSDVYFTTAKSLWEQSEGALFREAECVTLNKTLAASVTGYRTDKRYEEPIGTCYDFFEIQFKLVNATLGTPLLSDETGTAYTNRYVLQRPLSFVGYDCDAAESIINKVPSESASFKNWYGGNPSEVATTCWVLNRRTSTIWDVNSQGCLQANDTLTPIIDHEEHWNVNRTERLQRCSSYYEFDCGLTYVGEQQDFASGVKVPSRTCVLFQDPSERMKHWLVSHDLALANSLISLITLGIFVLATVTIVFVRYRNANLRTAPKGLRVLKLQDFSAQGL